MAPRAAHAIHSALSARLDAPFSNLKELIAYAKKNPGKLNYGLSAVGSLGHLTVEMLKRQGGLDIVNLPFEKVIGERAVRW